MPYKEGNCDNWTRVLPSFADREDIDPLVNIDNEERFPGEPKYNGRLPWSERDDEVLSTCLSFNDKENYWCVIPWAERATKVPFGYRSDPNYPGFAFPVPEELDLLETAKEHLKKYSYGTVARWMSYILGRKITYRTLWNRVNGDKKRQQRAIALRKWAARYKQAIYAAEKIEQTSPGAKAFLDEDVYDKDGVLWYAQKRKKAAVSSAPRPHPHDFDDGTPAEDNPETPLHARRSGPGPRRPRCTRKSKGDVG